MPTVEISLPEDVHAQFDRLVDEEFVSEEAAAEELLTAGLEAYTREFTEEEGAPDMADEYADDMWDTAEDPAGHGPDDDYI